MGHANLDNLSKIFIKKIYAKGKISLKDISEWCAEKINGATNKEKTKQLYGFRASEGAYTESDEIAIGFDHIIAFHYENKVIEPVITNSEEKRIIESYTKNGLDFTDSDNELFDQINWKFTNGSRKKYLENKIEHIANITE